MKKERLTLQDLTAKQWRWLERETLPHETTITGLDASEGATELHIYYCGSETIVVPCGEHQNAEPWRFDRHLTPEQVKEEYLSEMREEK